MEFTKTYPKTLHHLVAVDTELLGVLDGELADGEGPAVKTGTEGNGTLLGVDLDITENLVEVGGDNDVDGLNGTREVLVKVLLAELELEKSTVDLVDDKDGLDALTKSLAEHSLGLNADTLDGVDDDESTVSDTESGGNLRREIDVTGRVDQVDQELVLLGGDRDVLKVLLVTKSGVEGDSSGLDGHTTLLLIGTSVGETGRTGVLGGNDTGTLDERVGKGGLSVVDVSNDGHVTDVLGDVHETTDLLDGEAVGRMLSADCVLDSLATWAVSCARSRCRRRPQVDGVDLLDHLGGICGWFGLGKVFLDDVLEADRCPACKYSVSTDGPCGIACL
jgi:hypothetical protein